MNYSEISSSFAQVESWLRIVAPNSTNTRLSEYRRKLNILMDPTKLSNLSAHFDEQERRDLFFMFEEIHELGSIYRTLYPSHESILRRWLPKAIVGPADARTENPNNRGNYPRNLQFELFFMAQMVQAGFPVFEGGLEDVKSAFLGTEIFVECKRPQKQSGIHAAIRDATAQLKLRMVAANKPISLVAISLTKCLSSGTTLVKADDENEAGEIVSRTINASIAQEGAYFLKQAGTSVSGMLVMATGSTIPRHKQGIISISKQNFFDNPQLDPERYGMVKRWYEEYSKIRNI